MTQQHPIAPPPELVQQWYNASPHANEKALQDVATTAAQWGADQELLACGNYLKQCAQWEEEDVTEFYNYRRPKPPSLKEQALARTNAILNDRNSALLVEVRETLELNRRALEQLDD
jgi:hypothetical protein